MQRLMAASLALVVSLIGASSVTFAADRPPREVNLTSDSAPGWQPSPELEQKAQNAISAYLRQMDEGRYADAYAALDPINRQESFDAFSARLRKFNALAGPVQERRIQKITWTKNPVQAPVPGVYVAIDLASRFTNIDRHCGYVVLYQQPTGGDFHVMRSEDTYLDNATAETIAKQHSRVGVDEAWAKASANCPNYDRASAAREPLPETPGSSIGYPTVAAALRALPAKPGIVITTQQGWTVATDNKAMTIWSFAPAGNPAYPAAVKREIENRNGGAYVDMTVRCEASKSACDDLVRSFQALNEQMARSLRGR